MKYLTIAISLLLILNSCKSSKENSMQQTTQINAVVQQTIVYKTSANFNNLVPVIMNDEKTLILSYPAPSDLFFESKLATPTILKNGYLLDNRGINKNVAFLKFSYEEYSKLSDAPSMETLLSSIVEKYPLLELINCGKRNEYKNIISDLNKLIDADFPNCKRTEIVPMQISQ